MRLCLSCQAGCCRRFNVPITGYDIIKIRKLLGIEYFYFASITPVEEEYLEKDSKKLALFKLNNIGKYNYYTFYLRSIKSRYAKDTDRCMFLQEWGMEDFLLPESVDLTARCGIYQARPLACTIYPAKLHENELIGVTKNPSKTIEKPEFRVYELCPDSLSAEDFKQNSEELMKNLVLYKYEMNYFKFLSRVWNEGNGDFGEFFPFLEEGYMNRIAFEE